MCGQMSHIHNEATIRCIPNNHLQELLRNKRREVEEAEKHEEELRKILRLLEKNLKRKRKQLRQAEAHLSLARQEDARRARQRALEAAESARKRALEAAEMPHVGLQNLADAAVTRDAPGSQGSMGDGGPEVGGEVLKDNEGEAAQ